MLDLILDKEFANTFHLSYNSVDKEYIDDFYGYFCKKLKNWKLISNYLDIDDLKKQTKDNPFLELLIECNPELDFQKDLLVNIDSVGFPDSGSPFKLILTGENTKTCEDRRKRFGLEYLNPANLSDRWQLYYSQRPDKCRTTTYNSEIPEEQRFDTWKKIKTFGHPLNSIIFIDLYFLKWKTEKELDENIRNNFLPLFENLLSESANETSIEIMIVSIIDKKSPLELEQEKKVQLSQERLETLLKLKTQKAIKVNIIAYSKSEAPSGVKLHDRMIITNYFYIKSGEGFNIFNTEGSRKIIKTSTDIEFIFIHNFQYLNSALSNLKQLAAYCKKIENKTSWLCNLNYYPTKTNRLLNI